MRGKRWEIYDIPLPEPPTARFGHTQARETELSQQRQYSANCGLKTARKRTIRKIFHQSNYCRNMIWMRMKCDELPHVIARTCCLAAPRSARTPLTTTMMFLVVDHGHSYLVRLMKDAASTFSSQPRSLQFKHRPREHMPLR